MTSLKGGISIDADSGLLKYVVWCCGSICRQLLTFIQICSGHTVGAVLLKVGLFRKISWCSWWSSNLDAKSTFEMFWFYWHFLHQFIIFSKYLGCRITVCSLRILMLFFLKVHNFFRKAQVCLLFSQSGKLFFAVHEYIEK